MYGVHFVNIAAVEDERMSTEIEVDARPRVPLTRERVLHTAVALADKGGVEALSMRKLAQALDVVPMALYRHVANKDELLDGLVDVVVGEFDPPLDVADQVGTCIHRGESISYSFDSTDFDFGHIVTFRSLRGGR